MITTTTAPMVYSMAWLTGDGMDGVKRDYTRPPHCTERTQFDRTGLDSRYFQELESAWERDLAPATLDAASQCSDSRHDRGGAPEGSFGQK